MFDRINALCIDVDDLAAAVWEGGFSRRESEYLVAGETAEMLDGLQRLDITATFFIPGHVVRRTPELVVGIQAAGHQIASHGSRHCSVARLGPSAFRSDIDMSRKSLEDLTGEVVDIYKAPSWSITPESLWAYDVLVDAGFRVDNSAMPSLKRSLGYDSARLAPFVYKDVLTIVPPTVVRIGGVTVPLFGGFYSAHVPLAVQARLLENINRTGQPFNYYFHPFEYAPADANRRWFKHRSMHASLYAAHAGVFRRHLPYLAARFRFGTLDQAYGLTRQVEGSACAHGS